MGAGRGQEGQQGSTEGQALSQLLPSSVTLGKPLGLSVPQFPFPNTGLLRD